MSDEPHISSVTRREFVAASASLVASAAAMPVLGQPGGAPRRVIIDTDPGVDDAFALLLAMRSPELRIEGITPVAGNVPLELTLPNALRMVEIAGRTDIPVAAGASRPLERRLVTATYAHGENGLGGAVFPEPKLKPIADPIIVCTHAQTPEEILRPKHIAENELNPCEELGATMASGIALGIF